MGHTHVKLSWILKLPWEPLLVDFHKLLNAIEKFIYVEQGHIDVVGRVKELPKVMIGFECLCFTSFRILNHIETFVARDAVVKRGGCDWNCHGTIRNDLWFLPPGFFGPIYHQHVISVCLSKHEILWLVRFYLFHSSWRYFQVLCIESTKLFSLFLVNRSFGLNLGHGSESSSNKSFT
jgi:hypothetical protein